MTDRAPLIDAVSPIFTENCTTDVVRAVEEGEWPAGLWNVLADAGLPWVSVPEASGGSGGTFAEALTILLVAGRNAAPVPLAETGPLGGWMLSEAGLEIPRGPVTVGVTPRSAPLRLSRRRGDWVLDGELHRVPWARAAERIVVLARGDDVDHVVSVAPGSGEIRHRTNLAGEPRESVRFTSVVIAAEHVAVAPPAVDRRALRLRGALARAALMAGALDRVTGESIAYSRVRQQFGRPISQFQAVRGHLVKIAQRAATARLAVETAIEAAGASDAPPLFETASAKILTGEAAGVVAASAHQVHGAIGMTREHHLPAFTRRLWSWRDEFGAERHWSTVLGRELADRGPGGLWPRIAQDLVEA